MTQSEKILTAAFDCISSKGYANVSLREIAEEAGVVLSQLNYYYKNKEGLFIEVLRMMMQKYLQEVEAHIKTGISPKEKMMSLIKYFQVMLDENPKLFKLLYDFAGLSLWTPMFAELLRELFNDLATLINQHILNDISATNNLHGYTTTAIARLLFGAMFGTAIQVILDPQEKDLPEALKAIELVIA